MNPSTHDLNCELTFTLKEASTGRELKLSFDDLDFIIRSTQLSFPQMFPDEPFSDAELSTPAFKRMQATNFVQKFIPELRKKLNEELGCSITSAQAEKLYRAHRTSMLNLKKSTEDATSSASSTDSTASTSPTNTQPPSLSDSTKQSVIIGSSSNPVMECPPPMDSVKSSEL